MNRPQSLPFALLLCTLYSFLVIGYVTNTQSYLHLTIISSNSYQVSELHVVTQATLSLHLLPSTPHSLTIDVDDAGAGLTRADISLTFSKSFTITNLSFTNSACSSISHVSYLIPGTLSFSCTLAHNVHHSQISQLGTIAYTLTSQEPTPITFNKGTLLQSGSTALFYRLNELTIPASN